MSGTDDLYIGLIPPQAGCGGTCGLGGGMTALYFTDNLPEASHEIGHALGRPHTPCSVHASGEDPNYPVYSGYPRGSIGEVGVDPTRLTTFDPNTTFDFMSYCDPLWVSPWTYQQLSAEIFRAARTSAPRALQSSPWDAEAAEFYHVAFRIHRATRNEPPRVDLTSAFHLRRSAPRFSGDSEVTVELLGEAGQLLAVQAAPRAHAHAGEGDPFVDHRACFPAHAELRSIRVVRTGSVLAEWPVAARAPSLAITETRHEPHQDRFVLRWSGDAGPETAPSLSYGVRYSHDGKRWRAVAAGLTGTELAIDSGVAAGRRTVSRAGDRVCRAADGGRRDRALRGRREASARVHHQPQAGRRVRRRCADPAVRCGVLPRLRDGRPRRDWLGVAVGGTPRHGAAGHHDGAPAGSPPDHDVRPRRSRRRGPGQRRDPRGRARALRLHTHRQPRRRPGRASLRRLWSLSDDDPGPPTRRAAALWIKRAAPGRCAVLQIRVRDRDLVDQSGAICGSSASAMSSPDATGSSGTDGIPAGFDPSPSTRESCRASTTIGFSLVLGAWRLALGAFARFSSLASDPRRIFVQAARITVQA